MPDILYFALALVLLAASARGAHGMGTALDPGILEHAGGYVLELDAPSPRTRGKCLEVTLSNFAKLSDRKLWLVVRSIERDGTRPTYENVALVDAPEKGVGTAAVCLPRAPEAARGRGFSPDLIQVAVYRASARDVAGGFWPGPADDGMRLSNWLSLPETVLRGRLFIADTLSRSRAP